MSKQLKGRNKTLNAYLKRATDCTEHITAKLESMREIIYSLNEISKS